MAMALESVIAFILQLIDCVINFFHRLCSRSETDIEGWVAVVTGGGRGIGHSIVKELLRRGAKVAILDHDTTKTLDDTVNALKEGGNDKIVRGYACDVSDLEKVTRTLTEVKRDLGPVDILINNAGIITGKSLVDLPIDRIEKIIGVNLFAHFLTIKTVLPGMKDRGRGFILNVASMAGATGLPLLSDYCATKSAVIGLTESLRRELKIEGSPVSVSLLMPNVVRTAMNESYLPPQSVAVSPPMTTEAVASKAVSWLLRGRFYIIVPASNGLLFALKGILPIAVIDKVLELMGVMTISAL